MLGDGCVAGVVRVTGQEGADGVYAAVRSDVFVAFLKLVFGNALDVGKADVGATCGRGYGFLGADDA